MANVKGRPTEAIPPHKVLREVLRHYTEYRDYVSSTGNDVIEHGYFVYEDDGEAIKQKVAVTVSFSDLRDALKPNTEGGILSDRKREALLYNVVFDWKQKHVAELMGITTVTVGQYVEQACRQLAERYFAEDEVQ